MSRSNDNILSLKEINVNKHQASKFSVSYYGEINDELGVMKVKIPTVDVKLSATNASSKNKDDHSKNTKTGQVPLNEVSEFISRFTTKQNRQYSKSKIPKLIKRRHKDTSLRDSLNSTDLNTSKLNKNNSVNRNNSNMKLNQSQNISNTNLKNNSINRSQCSISKSKLSNQPTNPKNNDQKKYDNSNEPEL